LTTKILEKNIFSIGIGLKTIFYDQYNLITVPPVGAFARNHRNIPYFKQFYETTEKSQIFALYGPKSE